MLLLAWWLSTFCKASFEEQDEGMLGIAMIVEAGVKIVEIGLAVSRVQGKAIDPMDHTIEKSCQNSGRVS
jgi:hypothetical protein